MHEKGEACVLPILLRPVDWRDAPFAKLQILPTGAKPITRWLDPEEALEDVAKESSGNNPCKMGRMMIDCEA